MLMDLFYVAICEKSFQLKTIDFKIRSAPDTENNIVVFSDLFCLV